MKNIGKLFGIIAVAAVIGFSMAACDDGGNPVIPPLTGEVTISPSGNVPVGTELTATYDGPENILEYQWRNGAIEVGTNSSKFTPEAAGLYTVTVIAYGYLPKLSDAVTVGALSVLSGTVDISPSGFVSIGTELTATYDGPETVSYKWKKGASDIPDATSNKFTPTETGVYTVTVSAEGYLPKISNIVSALPILSGDITISPSDNVTTGTELTADYDGTETVSYQWKKGTNEIAGETSSRFTPADAGVYTVTVSAENYISKTGPAVIVFSPETPDLPGTITISPSDDVVTGMELTATYSGTEIVSYQWKKGFTNVGTNSDKFTPAEAGVYTVTVSADGYKNKTSALVTVLPQSTPNLPGTITISPSAGAVVGMELTATYSGTETVNYQWKNLISNVGTNSDKFSPTEIGTYTVTVSADGYRSKTSAPVTVSLSRWNDVSDSKFGSSEIKSIVYDAGKFVAVGYDGKIAYSSDGVTWTAATEVPLASGNESKIQAVTYGDGGDDGGFFVAVSYGSEGFVISEDGSTWQKPEDEMGNGVDLKLDGYLYAIGFGNGLFVVGNQYGKMISSSGGDITEITNSTFGTSSIKAIAYGGGKFVAGGDNGKIAVSSDGAAWTAANTGSIFGALDSINAITYANGKFVAVGSGGKIATSTDGSTWTAANTGGAFDYTVAGTTVKASIYAIAFGNGKFIAGGDAGKMATSTDGVTWTAESAGSAFGINPLYANIQAIAYGSGKFVAGVNGGKMAYLTDN